MLTLGLVLFKLWQPFESTPSLAFCSWLQHLRFFSYSFRSCASEFDASSTLGRDRCNIHNWLCFPRFMCPNSCTFNGICFSILIPPALSRGSSFGSGGGQHVVWG